MTTVIKRSSPLSQDSFFTRTTSQHPASSSSWSNCSENLENKMFHLSTDVRIGDIRYKQDWKEKHLNSIQKTCWRVRCDRERDGHRRTGVHHAAACGWCLPPSTAANLDVPRALGMASVHLEAQTMLSNAVQQRSLS